MVPGWTKEDAIEYMESGTASNGTQYSLSGMLADTQHCMNITKTFETLYNPVSDEGVVWQGRFDSGRGFLTLLFDLIMKFLLDLIDLFLLIVL